MPQSVSFLFKRSFEFVPIHDIESIPPLLRGIYVLYHQSDADKMNVVYVGMARGDRTGVKGRLKTHKSKKPNLWTHFSVLEVWDNITKQQVEELEGLFRHLYRRDASANALNKQKAYAPLRELAKQTKANVTRNAL